MDLPDLMDNVKQMLEEDNEELQRCLQEREKRDSTRVARLAEKEKDMNFLREKIVEVQGALEILKEVRADANSAQLENEHTQAGGERRETC